MDGRREKLMACITATSFVCDELRLFLDTHPMDQAALEEWDRMSKVRNEAVYEYTNCFGPIESYRVESDNNWAWVEDPWPWEGRC
ncbi:MAG: spore coat protein CotJB [Mobilitalea sp.]